MNKILYLSLFFCFSLAGRASTPSEVVILLESISKSGVILKKDIVLIKNSSVIVNREKLEASEIITQAESLKNISTFVKLSVEERCLAGSFRHLYVNGKKKKEEFGCLGSDRFLHLEKSFKALKKDSMTEI